MRDSAGEQVRHWYRSGAIDPVTAFLARTRVTAVLAQTTAVAGAGGIVAGAVLRVDGLLVGGIALAALGLLTVAVKLLARIPSREGIGVGDNGVLVRSRSRPDQWVPWSEVEKFGVISQGGLDAISIIRSNAEPLLAGRFYSSSLSRGRNAPVIKAYRIQHALEHERVEAIRAARRSARSL
jgi:hypothetical protein